MVLFKCKTCAATVMHRDVVKHVGKCPGPLAMKCVDCSNDFFGQQYEQHTRCSAPRVQEIPKVQDVLKVPEMTKKKPNRTKKPKTPKKRAAKGVKKGVSGTVATSNQHRLLQEQWKKAGSIASKDPTLTSQQRFLLVNASKRLAPKKMSEVKKTLVSINKKVMTAYCITELVQEVLHMVESEFKNINRPQEEDAADLTANQQLIGAILSASEAPGLKPHQKSLLASLASDNPRKPRMLKDYARVTWSSCQHRAEVLAGEAYERFKAELLKIRTPSKGGKKNAKANNTGVDAVNGTKKEQEINCQKETGTEAERKKKKRKKQMDGETIEKETGGAKEISNLDTDNSEKQSKKGKHEGGRQNGALVADSATDAGGDTIRKKSKARKKEKVSEVEMTNGCAKEISEDATGKKGKKSRGEVAIVAAATEDVDGSEEVVADRKKKKKHKRQEEAEEDGRQRKKSKTVNGEA